MLLRILGRPRSTPVFRSLVPSGCAGLLSKSPWHPFCMVTEVARPQRGLGGTQPQEGTLQGAAILELSLSSRHPQWRHRNWPQQEIPQWHGPCLGWTGQLPGCTQGNGGSILLGGEGWSRKGEESHRQGKDKRESLMRRASLYQGMALSDHEREESSTSGKGSDHQAPVPSHNKDEPTNSASSSSLFTVGLGAMAHGTLALSSCLCEGSGIPPETFSAPSTDGGSSLLLQFYYALTDTVAQGFHSFQVWTGTDWWISIVLGTVAFRLLLLPLTVKQMRVGAELSLLSPQLPPWYPVPGSGKSWRQARREYSQKLRELGGPSPFWLYLAPIVQVPLFLSLVLSLRRMASSDYPGLDSGGALWFQDLTSTASGPLAWVFPCAIALSFWGSFVLSFAPPPVPPGYTGPRPGILQRTHLPLLLVLYSFWLEFMTVPTFFTSRYFVPQAVHVYWLTNNIFSLGQSVAVRSDPVRRTLGIPTIEQLRQAAVQHRAAAAKGRVTAGSPPFGEVEGPVAHLQDAMGPSVNAHCDPTQEEGSLEWEMEESTAKLLEFASRLKAKGNDKLAKSVLERASILDPGNRSVWLGLGHSLFDQKSFKESAEAFTRAAQLAREGDAGARLIALKGAGFSYFNLGQLDRAEAMLRKAASMSLEGTEVEEDAFHKRWHGSTMVALASLLTRRNEDEEALKWLQKASSYDPAIRDSMIVPLERKMSSER